MNRLWNIVKSVKNVTYNAFKTIYNYVTQNYEKAQFDKNKELKHARNSLRNLNKQLTQSRIENSRLKRKFTQLSRQQEIKAYRSNRSQPPE